MVRSPRRRSRRSCSRPRARRPTHEALVFPPDERFTYAEILDAIAPSRAIARGHGRPPRRPRRPADAELPGLRVRLLRRAAARGGRRPRQHPVPDARARLRGRERRPRHAPHERHRRGSRRLRRAAQREPARPRRRRRSREPAARDRAAAPLGRPARLRRAGRGSSRATASTSSAARRPRDGRCWRRPIGAAPGRRRADALHLGHHRPAEGLPAHARRRPRAPGATSARAARDHRGRPHVGRPAPLPHVVPRARCSS